MQAGDVQKTISNSDKLKEWVDFMPHTNVKEGISNFIKWYRNYYNV